jgi:hypothetical protein
MKKMYEDEEDIELNTSYHMNTPDVSADTSMLNMSNPANMTID